VGTHADADTECAAVDSLANGLRRGTSLWSHDGQNTIASLPLAPHTAYRRSELQALYQKFEAEIRETKHESRASLRTSGSTAADDPSGVGAGHGTGDRGVWAIQHDSQTARPWLVIGDNSAGIFQWGRQRLGGLTKQAIRCCGFSGGGGAHAVRRDPELQRFYRRNNPERFREATWPWLANSDPAVIMLRGSD